MEMYDLIIIGAGPAGLTAALYAARARKRVLVLDGGFGSGEAGKIARLDNYPGIASIDGVSYLLALKEQATESGAQFVSRNALSVDCEAKTVSTRKETYQAKAIVLATGCKAQKLGVEGEKQLVGVGVSYCATCDGPLYKNKTVVIVGSGVKARSDVGYLAGVASKVYYVTSDPLVYEADNVQTVFSSVTALEGNPLTAVVLADGTRIETPILFVNVGYLPQSELLIGQVETDEKGFVLTDENMQTSRNGIYAVGDVRKKFLRQIVTACSDGAIAAETVVRKKENV